MNCSFPNDLGNMPCPQFLTVRFCSDTN